MLDVLAFVQSNLLCRCQLRHLLNQGLELMVQWKVFAVHCKLTRNLACYRTWGNYASSVISSRPERRKFILGGHLRDLNGDEFKLLT